MIEIRPLAEGRQSGFCERSIDRNKAERLIPWRVDAPVAQLDRALPSEGKGREFESRRARHFQRKWLP